MKTTTNTAVQPYPRHTPWGAIQHEKETAPGIVWYSTAGHGGYFVSEDRRAQMPEGLRSIRPFAGEGWYEEDCDWAIVVAAFWQYFTPAEAYFAGRALNGLSYAAMGWATFLMSDDGNVFTARARDFYEANKEKFTLGGCSTRGGKWEVSAYSLDARQSAIWAQDEYPSYGGVFDIAQVTAAGHTVRIMERTAA